MLNIQNKKMIDSRNVVWLRKNFKVWFRVKFPNENDEVDDDNDNFITKVSRLNQVNHEIESINQVHVLSKKSKVKIYCDVTELESFFNLENTEQGSNIFFDQLNLLFLMAYGIIPVQRIASYGKL